MQIAIESCASGCCIWDGDADSEFDAVRKLYADSGAEFDDDDNLESAVNPEWQADYYVTGRRGGEYVLRRYVRVIGTQDER